MKPLSSPATLAANPWIPHGPRARLAIAGMGLLLLAGCDREKSGPAQPTTAALPGTSAPPPPASLATNRPPGDVPPGMVWIPGGEFSMGSTAHSAIHCDSACGRRAAVRCGAVL